MRFAYALGLFFMAIAWPGHAATRNGDLDPNFGAGGLVLADIGAGSGHWADMAIDGQGRILLAGSTDTGPATGYDFVIVRLLPDGSPDTSFSFDGKVEVAVGPGDSQDYLYALLVQADGRIVAAGAARSTTAGNGQDMAFVRFHENGTLDTGFGNGGKVFVHFGEAGVPEGADTLRGLAQLPDGKLIGAGTTAVNGQSDDMAIVKLNTDGSRDTSFGAGGRVTVRFSLSPQFLMDQAAAVAFDSAGRIVVAGLTAKSSAADLDMAVARLLADGQLDPDFGGDGRVTVPFDLSGQLQDIAYGLHVGADDSIALIGSADDVGADAAIVRLLPDGSLDTGFGGDGRVTVPFDQGGENADVAFSLQVLEGGGFIVTGMAIGATSFRCLLAQVLPDGQLDPAFGVVGKVLIDNPFGGNQMGCTRARLHEGRLFLGGLTNTVADGVEFGLTAGVVLIDVLFANGYESD